jgi:TorA maturation chaperone TorD
MPTFADSAPGGDGLGRAELFRALGVASEPSGCSQRALWQVLELGEAPLPSGHTELFVLQLPAYAAVYLGAEGMLGGEAADRVAGFWRALGLSPPPDPDHLACILGLYAALIEASEAVSSASPASLAAPRRARASLAWEHLLSWAPIFAVKAAEVGSAPYRAWAALLLDALLAEAEELDPAPVLPLHLREAPPVADPAEGGQAFVSALLVPARTGMVLTRSDLARAGAELGLGVRIGERRFSLAAMLGEDPAGVLAWLGAEAIRWAGTAQAMVPALGGVATWWSERAAASSAMLGTVAAAAGVAATGVAPAPEPT